MKKIFYLFLMTITLQNYAQEFAPVGAIWHYTQATINPNLTTFKTIESIKDTTINNIQCRKMIEVERILDTFNVSYFYMYSANDSVFFFDDNEFHLLYDFSANEGDTVILSHYLTSEGTPLLMIIDSTEIITVSGQNRKLQHITCGDGLSIEFGKQIIEGIGCTYFMFPLGCSSINGPLRCYQDNSTGLYLNPFYQNQGWNSQDCEEIITSIETYSIVDDITIYPNPCNGILNIEFSNAVSGSVSLRHTATQLSIYNTMGQKVLSKEIPTTKGTCQIDVSNLPKGIYFIDVAGIVKEKFIHK